MSEQARIEGSRPSYEELRQAENEARRAIAGDGYRPPVEWAKAMARELARSHGLSMMLTWLGVLPADLAPETGENDGE